MSVWRCNHHPLYYCITCTRSSLSCLLTFYGIPIFHTFLIRRIFCLLVSFPFFTAFTCMVCNIILGHKGPHHNVWPGAIFCCFLIIYKQNMLLHDLSWIPIFVQGFISISYLVFEVRLSKLNNNNNNNNNNNKNFENRHSWINQLPITWFKPFLG